MWNQWKSALVLLLSFKELYLFYYDNNLFKFVRVFQKYHLRSMCLPLFTVLLGRSSFSWYVWNFFARLNSLINMCCISCKVSQAILNNLSLLGTTNFQVFLGFCLIDKPFWCDYVLRATMYQRRISIQEIWYVRK